MSATEPATTLRRGEVYPGPTVDGAPAGRSALQRLRRRVDSLLVSPGERQEADVARLLRELPGVTRPNTVAVISPKGGVGKTTSTFVLGNLLATHLNLRAVAVDANPDFGTLAALAPDRLRTDRSLADLLDDMGGLHTAASLRPYVSRLASGLHILAAPRDAELMRGMGPDRYGELLAYLQLFYEVVLLDLGTGVTGPLARFALERADQVVLVTTPEWVTSSVVLDALGHLTHERTTVVVNKSHLRAAADRRVIERRFREQRLHRSVVIPYDQRLQTMLDTGTYTLDALERPTRLPVKRLALAIAEQLA